MIPCENEDRPTSPKSKEGNPQSALTRIIRSQAVRLAFVLPVSMLCSAAIAFGLGRGLIPLFWELESAPDILLAGGSVLVGMMSITIAMAKVEEHLTIEHFADVAGFFGVVLFWTFVVSFGIVFAPIILFWTFIAICKAMLNH